MNTLSHSLFQRKTINGVIVDISALAFIYLVPTLTHLLSLPLYLIDPMRLMVILALVHSNKMNGYMLALSLPVFSLLVSGHPVFPKMVLITVELTFNVFLFYIFIKKLKYPFAAILLSIVFSKTLYYILKFFLIQLTVINSDLITTPVMIQVVTTVIFSLYMFLFIRKRELKS